MAQELVWLDLEMTGLDPKRHRIIEIDTIITDLYWKFPMSLISIDEL